MFQTYLSVFSEKNRLKFQEVLQILHFLLGGEVSSPPVAFVHFLGLWPLGLRNEDFLYYFFNTFGCLIMEIVTYRAAWDK